VTKAEQEKERLVQSFAEMYEALRQWRADHPEASFDEIAAQVTARRRVLMGDVLKSLASQHGRGEVAVGLRCEQCGQPLRYKGQAKRVVEHYLEGESQLERAYYYCPACEAGFFPPG
jgi:hypothetical protein